MEFWENGTIPWLNSGAVNDGRIYEASAYITQEAFESSSAKWIPPGALLMALAGQGKTKGMVAQLMFESTCNQSMAAIVPTVRIEARFLYWWLTCNYQNIRNMAGGDLRDGLNLDLLGAIPCPLPPADEQSTIAAFLDRETANIDTLIAEQEKLVALLAEKRQAAISHAVTHGLNSSAPMKDVGVPWMEKVPMHWECRKLSTLTCGIGDGLHGTPTYVDASEYFFINGNNLSGGVIAITESTRCVSEEEHASQSIQLGNNSVLLSINGTIGNVALYNGEKVMLGKSAAYINCSSEIKREFLAYFLLGDNCKSYFAQSLSGTTISNLSLETIRFTRIPTPPLSEQTAIVSFLETETTKLNLLRIEAERAVALLKERRSSLIAAAISGQIDVRHTMRQPATKNIEAIAA
jgi:type I restriction enzyme S subunit